MQPWITWNILHRSGWPQSCSGTPTLAWDYGYMPPAWLFGLFLNPVSGNTDIYKVIPVFRFSLSAYFWEKKFCNRYDFSWHRGNKGALKRDCVS